MIKQPNCALASVERFAVIVIVNTEHSKAVVERFSRNVFISDSSL